MNAYQVNFESVYRIEDASIVPIFKTLETTGFQAFLNVPDIIYEDTLLDLRQRLSHRYKTYIIFIGWEDFYVDEALFAYTFNFTTQGLSDISHLSCSILSQMNLKFSSFDNTISDSFKNK